MNAPLLPMGPAADSANAANQVYVQYGRGGVLWQEGIIADRPMDAARPLEMGIGALIDEAGEPGAG